MSRPHAFADEMLRFGHVDRYDAGRFRWTSVAIGTLSAMLIPTGVRLVSGRALGWEELPTVVVMTLISGIAAGFFLAIATELRLAPDADRVAPIHDYACRRWRFRRWSLSSF